MKLIWKVNIFIQEKLIGINIAVIKIIDLRIELSNNSQKYLNKIR